jgi:hypothetical protein
VRNLALAHHCAQLLMGCHPHRDAWIHHTGSAGGVLGIALFLCFIGYLADGGN